MAEDRKSQEEEIIVNDRRPRFDMDAPEEVVSTTEKATAGEEPESHGGMHDHAGEDGQTKAPRAPKLEHILSFLAGMALSHLGIDPETGVPDAGFSVREARFMLSLMEMFQEAFRDKLPISALSDRGDLPAEEEPRLGHIPALLGALAINALGVDPRTGQQVRNPEPQAAQFYIDLMDLFLKESGDSLPVEDRDYIKDMLYQTRMFFVRQRDKGSKLS
ncbi:MAG: hypothetical protein ACYCXP_03915 [Leptospirillum sp.]